MSKERISLSAQSVNFREIHLGNIAPNTLFRSSHPIKDYKQEKTISILASKIQIKTVINLCDTMSGIIGKSVVAPWYNNLFKNGKVVALGMDFSLTSSDFKRKFNEALQFIIHTEAPWFIHCHAGIDRTGFVCMVLESFMGASLDEVIEDYLKSFNGIFESSIYKAKKVDASTAMQILSIINDLQIIDDKNLQQIAETYLRCKIGLSIEEVELLRSKLSGKCHL